MIGQTISHYRIEKKLGAGGMGEVYLARDPHLGRAVAFKILPPDFVSDKQRLYRFIREAKAACVVSHPGIAHIYEIGESLPWLAGSHAPVGGKPVKAHQHVGSMKRGGRKLVD